MDFELTPDQELFIASAKEYAEKYFTPEAIKQAYEVDHHISLEAAMAFREQKKSRKNPVDESYRYAVMYAATRIKKTW